MFAGEAQRSSVCIPSNNGTNYVYPVTVHVGINNLRKQVRAFTSSTGKYEVNRVPL
jgi:hypothetical protein